MSFFKWSQTAATNSNADSTINWAEGQTPSSVNDSARGMMAAASKYRDDIAGAISTAGTSTAYTATSYQSFDTLAHMNGAMFAFTPHATSGATVTLNVDSLGAKPLRSAPSVELPSGLLVLGTPYVATYYNATTEWILQGFIGNPYNVPIGGFIPYVLDTAPNSSFVLPYGQAVSRTTYSALFTLTSTTFGVGDGSSTFNLPDIRGRTIAGLDNMGGSTAGRITNAGSSIVGTTIGATGGAQTVTVAQANLPNVNFTNSGIAIDISNGGTNATPLKSNSGSSGPGTASAVGSADGGTGGVINTPVLTVSVTNQGSAASGGSGTALNKMPPTIVLPKVYRII